MSGERWQVAGSAAEIYDNYLVPAVFGPWAEILVEAAGVGAGDRVVDVACGTGVAALFAAQVVSPGGVVTGIDLNPGMIAALLGDASDAAINALIADVSGALERYTDGGTGISFPIQGHVVTARA